VPIYVGSAHAMTEFEWQKKVSRKEAAAVLRAIADGLAGDGNVELEQNGWQLKVPVGPKIAVDLEVEVGESEAELEIELTWPTARSRRSSTGSSGRRQRRSPGRAAKGA
jgi:amphi-Trp domain-containing protein